MRSDMKDYRREYLRSIARFFSKKNIFRFFSLMLITTGILLYMQTFANQTDIDFSFDTGNKLLVR
ncbi:TPA: hypothetical protein DCZ39_03830 [Patescibacteria group bacterium]|nr:hypothetical protein [Candidatus Gracilibacteria bacterium]